MKKYFIAIVLPEPLQESVETLKLDLQARHGLKGALRSPAHITLHRPFIWKEEKETFLVDSLSRFATGNPFEIVMRDFAFFEPRVVYVNVEPSEELSQFHNNLRNFARKELKLLNEWEDERGFHPHATIASRDLKKSLFYALREEFIAKSFEGRFLCDRFCLLRLEKRWEVIRQFNF